MALAVMGSVQCQMLQHKQRAQPSSYEVELQAIEDYRRFAALTIQRFYRGWIVRLHRSRQEAALREQQQATAAQNTAASRTYKAARAIQDSWRSYRNRRIFRFYRDLIKFREAADPRQLLRSINAPEASLVEPAAGLHIRFRLGGSSFPPILLYKVFTHRPVTDICAFGPRDYAAEAAASKPTAAAATISHKQPAAAPTQQPAGTSACSSTCSTSNNSSSRHKQRAGWYSRDDRNGWRPVIELQQQTRYGMPAAGSSCSRTFSRTEWRRHVARRSRKHSRLQLAHSKQGAGQCSRGSAAGEDAEEPGYCSEPEMQRPRGGGSTTPPGSKQRHYHHSPLVRRAERAQRLKQRRRQWLLKMYKAGMHAGAGPSCCSSASGPAGSDAAAATGRQRSTAGLTQQQCQQQEHQHVQQALPCQRCTSEEQLLQQLEQQLLSQAASSSCAGPGTGAGTDSGTACQDDGWDLEELLMLGLDAGVLAWAQKLDFDSYQQQWSSTAVTLPSEAAVPQSEHALLQQLA